MDPLGDALTISGVKGALSTRFEAGGRWSVVLDECPGAALHAVIAGTAWLSVLGGETVSLSPGDAVLLPARTLHALGDKPEDPSRTLTERRRRCGGATSTGEVVRLGSLPATTRIVTIHYDSDPAALTQVLTLLPDLVHMRAEPGALGLSDAVRMLARELADPQIATQAVLRSLVDILLVQMLRSWLAGNPPECFGTWLGALRDPVVGLALQRLHEDPATPWTTASLAAALSVSRATLARRFPAATGHTPAAYLARWRMDVAAVQLRDSHDPLEAVAATVGYGSVPAFSRAFARAHGRTPGRYRSEARISNGSAFTLERGVGSAAGAGSARGRPQWTDEPSEDGLQKPGD